MRCPPALFLGRRRRHRDLAHLPPTAVSLRPLRRLRARNLRARIWSKGGAGAHLVEVRPGRVELRRAVALERRSHGAREEPIMKFRSLKSIIAYSSGLRRSGPDDQKCFIQIAYIFIPVPSEPHHAQQGARWGEGKKGEGRGAAPVRLAFDLHFLRTKGQSADEGAEQGARARLGRHLRVWQAPCRDRLRRRRRRVVGRIDDRREVLAEGGGGGERCVQQPRLKMRCTSTIEETFKDHDHDETTSRCWTLKPGGEPARAPAAPRGRHRRAVVRASPDSGRRAQPPHHPPRRRPRGGRVGFGPASGPERRRAGAQRRPRALLPTGALLVLVQKELLLPNGYKRLFAGAGPGAAPSTAQGGGAGLAGIRTCTRLCPRRRRPTPSARGAAPIAPPGSAAGSAGAACGAPLGGTAGSAQRPSPPKVDDRKLTALSDACANLLRPRGELSLW